MIDTLSDIKALQALILAHSKADTVLDALEILRCRNERVFSLISFDDLNALLLQMLKQAQEK